MSELKEEIVVTEPEVVTQPRWKSWALWVSVVGAVWTILSAFGVNLGVSDETLKTVLDAVGTILIGFGIVNNPTDSKNF